MKKSHRILPIRRKIKQLDWIMQWMIRTHNCAFCACPLSEGYNKRDPGKSITLHHTEGCREEDRWDDAIYVRKMVPAHKSCHRSYHLLKRLAQAGKNVNLVTLASYEACLAKMLIKQR